MPNNVILIFCVFVVEYFESLSNISKVLSPVSSLCIVCRGSVLSVCLSGLCIIFWGLVWYPDVSQPRSIPPPGPTAAAAAVPQAGAGSPPQVPRLAPTPPEFSSTRACHSDRSGNVTQEWASQDYGVCVETNRCSGNQ